MGNFKVSYLILLFVALVNCAPIDEQNPLELNLKNQEYGKTSIVSSASPSFIDRVLGDLVSEELLINGVKFPSDDDLSDFEGLNGAIYSGIVTFGHLPYNQCFTQDSISNNKIDIAIVGAPFDTGVSYSPGARFGPNGIRQASRRIAGDGLTPVRGPDNGKLRDLNPYATNMTIVDCGDVPMIPFDNRLALNQLYRGQNAIHKHSVSSESGFKSTKVITLGGDHTITLMNLKSCYEANGKKPLSVLHFDSHIDTWDPKILGGGLTKYASLNHGTFLHYAAEKGYISKTSSLHLGTRAPYISPSDIQHDIDCGFHTITARDLDTHGMQAIIDRVKEVTKGEKVYISLDIDVLDPAFAPGTGTMEPGGWTSRELLTLLDGLEGIDLVGADVVEVSPPFDTNAQITSLSASQAVDSMIGLMMAGADSDSE